MEEINVKTLEDCLVLLGSKKPFLCTSKINNNNCIEPFTKKVMLRMKNFGQ